MNWLKTKPMSYLWFIKYRHIVCQELIISRKYLFAVEFLDTRNVSIFRIFKSLFEVFFIVNWKYLGQQSCSVLLSNCKKTNTSVYRMPNIFVLEIKIRTNVSTCISLLILLVKLLVTNRKCSHAINDLFMYQAK